MRNRKIFAVMVLGALLVAPALFIAAMIQWIHYSPYGNPGALDTGIWLAAAGLIVVLVPAVFIVAQLAVPVFQGYRSWKRGLPPEQRFMMSLAEGAAMELAHQGFKHRNEQVQERLTASVMGDKPEDPWA